MPWQKVSSNIWVSSKKKLQKGLSTLAFRFAWISNVKVLKQIDFWVSPPLPPHSIILKSRPRLINLFPSFEHTYFIYTVICHEHKAPCDCSEFIGGECTQCSLALIRVAIRAGHKENHCQKSSFLSVVKSFELSVCVGTARAGANSPGANKLAARARRRRGENCVQLELADLVETKLSKAAVERAKSYRRCWMQILLGGAGKTLLRGFVKQRRRPAAGNFERSCRKLELCTASPGHAPLTYCVLRVHQLPNRTMQFSLRLSLQPAGLIENIRSNFHCACSEVYNCVWIAARKSSQKALILEFVFIQTDWQSVYW